MHHVYILYSPLVDRYFVGSTPKLDKSLKRHNSGKNKHTKTGIPWNLVYQEVFDDREMAHEKERRIKASESREELVQHIRGEK